MKKFTTLIITLALLLAMSACSQKPEPQPGTGLPSDETAATTAPEASENENGAETASPESAETSAPDEETAAPNSGEIAAPQGSQSAEKFSLFNYVMPQNKLLCAIYGGETYYEYSAIISKDSGEIDAYLKEATPVGNSVKAEFTPVPDENGGFAAGEWFPENELECNAVPAGTPLYSLGDAIIAVFPEPLYYSETLSPEDAVPAYNYGVVFKKCTGIHLHNGERVERSDGKTAILLSAEACADWIRGLGLMPSTEAEFNGASAGAVLYTFTCPESGAQFTYSNGAVSSGEGFFMAENPSEPPIRFPIDSDVLGMCSVTEPHIHPAERIVIERWDSPRDGDIFSEPDFSQILGADKLPALNAWLSGLGLSPAMEPPAERSWPMYRIYYPNSVHPSILYWSNGVVELAVANPTAVLDGAYLAANAKAPEGF